MTSKKAPASYGKLASKKVVAYKQETVDKQGSTSKGRQARVGKQETASKSRQARVGKQESASKRRQARVVKQESASKSRQARIDKQESISKNEIKAGMLTIREQGRIQGLLCFASPRLEMYLTYSERERRWKKAARSMQQA
ncbi:hypothetical protein Tco_1102063 [Tanacetum coccineum]